MEDSSTPRHARSSPGASSDREHAEALALAIEHGFVDANEAVDWACALVIAQPSPSAPLLELAGAVRPHPLDVVGMLRRFPGDIDRLRVFRSVLARALDFVRANPDAWPRISYALEKMALQGNVPEPLAGLCGGFDDERLLAEQGAYGTVAEVRAELLAFLESEAAKQG